MSDSFTLVLLKAKGYRVADVSSLINVTPRAVYQAIKCAPNSSRRVRLFISTVIGRPPSILFSDLPEKTKVVDDFEFMKSQQSGRFS